MLLVHFTIVGGGGEGGGGGRGEGGGERGGGGGNTPISHQIIFIFANTERFHNISFSDQSLNTTQHTRPVNS